MNFSKIKKFYICRKSGYKFMVQKILYPFVVFFTLSNINAQRHELGIQIGTSNLVGDIGRTSYVLQPAISGNFSVFGLPFYGGILYRMNFNPYQTVRLNLGYSHIQFSDTVAKEYYRRNRGLYGTNSIFHADVLFEYNFFPVNDEQKGMISPYIFGGIGALWMESSKAVIYNDYNRDASGNAIAPTSNTDFVTNLIFDSSSRKMTMAIPFGVGLKYKFNYNWALFAEFMFRPTFSDEVDYSQINDKDVKIEYNKDISTVNLESSPYVEVAESRAADLIKARQIGNVNSKDWVNSFTLGLTYSFGRPPCYCSY